MFPGRVETFLVGQLAGPLSAVFMIVLPFPLDGGPAYCPTFRPRRSSPLPGRGPAAVPCIGNFVLFRLRLLVSPSARAGLDGGTVVEMGSCAIVLDRDPRDAEGSISK